MQSQVPHLPPPQTPPDEHGCKPLLRPDED
jgi:hypothetical protein